MASTALIMTVLMAALISAGYSSRNDNGFGFGPKMFHYVNPFPNGPFPQLPWPINMPFPQFPNLLNINNIANQGGEPDSNFNGGAIVSQSTAVRGPDGEIQRQGGLTVLQNNNGEVTIQRIGNAPPVIVSHYTNSPLFDFEDHKNFMKNLKMKPFEMPPFKPFVMPKMKPIVIKPPNPDIIRDFVPGKNENFQGTYSSSSSFSKDVNGVKTSGGTLTAIQNDNGKVDEANVGFKKGPK